MWASSSCTISSAWAQYIRSWAVGGEIDAGQNLVLRLLAEAFEACDLVGLAGGPQLVERA